eukprot:ANDGO_03086.mRNA.1 hypothetical protein
MSVSPVGSTLHYGVGASSSSSPSKSNRPHTSLAVSFSFSRNTQFSDSFDNHSPSRQIEIFSGLRPQDSAQNRSVDFSNPGSSFHRVRTITPSSKEILAAMPKKKMSSSAPLSPVSPTNPNNVTNFYGNSTNGSSSSSSSSSNGNGNGNGGNGLVGASPVGLGAGLRSRSPNAGSFRNAASGSRSPSGTPHQTPLSPHASSSLTMASTDPFGTAEREFRSLSTVYEHNTINSNVKWWGRDSCVQKLPRSITPNGLRRSTSYRSRSPEPRASIQQFDDADFCRSELLEFERRLCLSQNSVST